jgi:hypothetical protein
MILTAAAAAMLDETDRMACHCETASNASRWWRQLAVVMPDGQERPTNERRYRVQRS